MRAPRRRKIARNVCVIYAAIRALRA
jgi:hypothetical protein